MSLYLHYGSTFTDVLPSETIRYPSFFNSKLHRTLNTNSLSKLISPYTYFKIKVYYKKPKKTPPLMSYNILSLTRSSSGIVTNIATPWLKIFRSVSH